MKFLQINPETGAVTWVDLPVTIGSGPQAETNVKGPEENPDRAIRTWGAAASALGVSRRTLERAREKHDPDRRPWFENLADLRRWWDRLGAPVPVAPRAPKPKPNHPDLDAFRRARKGR